ncbi:hypothetical protein, partial [Cellulosimicrobium funkei]|uniref:hypothetical protein n=1 Tax=Cellulosimicrobium funkei TaxID=264251 RepID=UPI003F8E68BE
MSPTETDTTTRGGPPGPRRTGLGGLAVRRTGARVVAGLGAGALVAGCALAALPGLAARGGAGAASGTTAGPADVAGGPVTADP